MIEPADRPYPIRLDELNSWARENRTTSDEARRRFIQFVILDSFSSAEIARSLAFKGGNALRFGYGYPRSTFDLDFTAIELEDEADTIRRVVDSAVRRGSSEFGIKCKVSSVHRNPTSLTKTMPTYAVKVAYSLPGDRHFADFLEADRTNLSVIPIDISFNDVVCETILVHFGSGDSAGIELCTLNDIVAEKLRSVLQQTLRNRSRPQDVYDIARVVRMDKANIDLEKIRAFVDEKCASRDIIFSLAAFDNEALTRAQYGYDELRADLRDEYIPFEEAWADVRSLVTELLALDSLGN